MKWKALITHPTVSGLTTSTPKAPAQGLSRHVQRLGVALTLLASALPAAAAESHLPYLDGPRAMIQRGVQAVLLCKILDFAGDGKMCLPVNVVKSLHWIDPVQQHLQILRKCTMRYMRL